MSDIEPTEERALDSEAHEVDLEDLYALQPKAVREPPLEFRQRMRYLGPGLILVGSVVGSGGIILTSSLGALVGFSMLWFVLLSCWSKNIIQAEHARYPISSGEPFLQAFNCLPGKFPALGGKKVSWYNVEPGTPLNVGYHRRESVLTLAGRPNDFCNSK